MEDRFLTLERLGLSPNQAKVYLALCILESEATVKSIRHISQVHREEIYRKLFELKELGFVEYIITKPRRFKAIPLKIVINTLLHHKSEEISNLQIESEKLLHDLENNRKESEPKEGNYDLRLIPKKRALFERIKTELNNLQNNLDAICTSEKGVTWLSNHKNHFIDALNRDVKIRFIIQKLEVTRFPKFLIKLQNNNNFQLRTINTHPPTCAGIYDQK
ncbi:MAG: helix-turn-helix domain-containing protein, partial [Candidatus Bathyarchaeota archaeon]